LAQIPRAEEEAEVTALVAAIPNATSKVDAFPSRQLELADTAPPDQDDSDYKALLLSTLKSLSPNGFERLCQRLLREAGFEQVTVTGKSGDGGIDGHGVLALNSFVSFRVLFQCKRFSGSVGPAQIRDFRGAMQGRADKGIVLTTGVFTADARREATRDGAPPIELVDAEKLVDLFAKLELGLRPLTTYEIDHSFFSEYR
jgi:restriction system protein